MVQFQVDPLVEALNHFYDPMVEPLDCKLFSPLHSQIEAERAPWMFYHVENSFSGVEFEHGTNENDAYISNFLDSILNKSDDNYSNDSCSQKNSTIECEPLKAMAFGKDGGSCSESDAEVAQVLVSRSKLVTYCSHILTSFHIQHCSASRFIQMSHNAL